MECTVSTELCIDRMFSRYKLILKPVRGVLTIVQRRVFLSLASSKCLPAVSRSPAHQKSSLRIFFRSVSRTTLKTAETFSVLVAQVWCT